MLQVTPHIRILVARNPIDFRKGMDGIARICQDALGEDPFSGTYFIFRNRRKTGLKILIYDGQGFWLCHKRLSKGQFKWWPSDDGKSIKAVESHDLQILLSAGNGDWAKVPPSWKKLN